MAPLAPLSRSRLGRVPHPRPKKENLLGIAGTGVEIPGVYVCMYIYKIPVYCNRDTVHCCKSGMGSIRLSKEIQTG